MTKDLEKASENIRMIICDLDGTLFPRGAEELSPMTIDVFQRAREKGLHVMINTGRHYTFLQTGLFEQLPLDLVGTINGACLNRRNGEIVEAHPIDDDVFRRILEGADRYHLGVGFKFPEAIVTYSEHDFYMKHYVKPGSRYEKMIINNCRERDYHLSHGNPLGTFIITEDESCIEKMRAMIPELTFAKATAAGYDVFLNTITKATSAEGMLKEYGLRWENVIAFGDAGNDLPFLSRAGISAAMGNAKDEVKKACDIIADTCMNDGVAKVLLELKIV